MLKRKDKQKQLHIKLTKLERELANDHFNKALKTEILTIKTQLEITALAAAHAAQIRTRAKFTEACEKNTAYFLALEKKNGINNTMSLETKDERENKKAS